MHSRFCLPFTLQGRVIVMPRYGDQLIVASGTDVSSGQAFRRNHIIVISLFVPIAAAPGDPSHGGTARLVHVGKTQLSTGLDPGVNLIIPEDDGENVLVTSTDGAAVWLLPLETFGRQDW